MESEGSFCARKSPLLDAAFKQMNPVDSIQVFSDDQL
jgi:hypothetical protein